MRIGDENEWPSYHPCAEDDTPMTRSLKKENIEKLSTLSASKEYEVQQMQKITEHYNHFFCNTIIRTANTEVFAKRSS